MILEHYLNLKTRNARAKELKSQGHKVLVRTSHGSLFHPQYILDWVGPEKYDVGFGNDSYKTHINTMYIVQTNGGE